MSTKNRQHIASAEATAAAGRFAATISRNVDTDEVKRWGNDPTHEVYPYVQAHIDSKKWIAYKRILGWIRKNRERNSRAVARAKHVKAFILLTPSLDPETYTLVYDLCDTVIETGKSSFSRSKTAIGTTTGLSTAVVKRRGEVLEKMGWCKMVVGEHVRVVTPSGDKSCIEGVWRAQAKYAPTCWNLDMDKMYSDLLQNLSSKARAVLKLPEGWEDRSPRAFHQHLDQMSEKIQDRLVPTIGDEECPVTFGSGVDRRVWDMLHAMPALKVKDMLELGYSRSTAYRLYGAATEVIEIEKRRRDHDDTEGPPPVLPAKVAKKARGKKARDAKIRLKVERFFQDVASGVKATFREVEFAASKVRTKVPFAPIPVPVPGPKPKQRPTQKARIEPPPQGHTSSSLPDLDANILM